MVTTAVNIIPTGTDSVFDVIKQLSTLDRQAIVRPENPPPGVAGYLFDIVGEESVELASDITDHYVENNTAIQDQIALRPEQIQIRGLVAELVNASGRDDLQAPVSDPLPINADLVPQLTPGAREQRDKVDEAEFQDSAAILSGQSLFGYYDNRTPSPNITRQAKAFNYFRQLWLGRQLFSVETPWGYWTNMAISSFRATQGQDTRYQSDFTLTLKKIRFAQDLTVSAGQLAGRAVPQRADIVRNGNAGRQEVSEQKKQSLIVRLTT